MPQINLNENNIRLFECEMTLHDYMWFSSYDASSMSSTEAVIHNFALSYAVSRYDRGIVSNRGPTYERDLEQMDFYASPAKSIDYKKITLTYNALDTKTLRTDEYNSKKNTPKLGQKTMVTPMSKFEFYLYSWGEEPTGLIRIGKKRALARISWKEIEEPLAFYQEDSFEVNHLVSPLDVTGEFERYNMIRIPPFLLLKDVKMKEDWIIKDGSNIIHLPRRILAEVGDET
ncbi:type I-D CRISPR-associated protein Cas5/Csc1 [Fuchsiella alkaliacetigena]|uniref:type I-D CRISPR-associated protein Cas5/Csc1 n=1 Tax=Fuchsiella alkaliacetigena TaxID=957042 RepID=UPI002009EE7A|nr:type I-D CRISPR-associated protein Cas5/Csc1 [Fuchsiella alkaliacetigena]MCK8825370.1 type I-D CRISPR-associated protein Cas5/Csc1 [Fuchsiella alkaliacetigena]